MLWVKIQMEAILLFLFFKTLGVNIVQKCQICVENEKPDKQNSPRWWYKGSNRPHKPRRWSTGSLRAGVNYLFLSKYFWKYWPPKVAINIWSWKKLDSKINAGGGVFGDYHIFAHPSVHKDLIVAPNDNSSWHGKKSLQTSCMCKEKDAVCPINNSDSSYQICSKK